MEDYKPQLNKKQECHFVELIYVSCVTFFGLVETIFTFFLPLLAAAMCLLNTANIETELLMDVPKTLKCGNLLQFLFRYL